MQLLEAMHFEICKFSLNMMSSTRLLLEYQFEFWKWG